jgi:ATP-dependent DNA helicase RecG
VARPNRYVRPVAAFANDLPGHGRPGTVIIGARDDGTTAGLEVTDQLLLQLADIKTDGNIVSPPTLSVTKQRLRGGNMVVVTVTPSDSPPVRFEGRIPIRIGPRRGYASAQDERILNERRLHHNQPFDMQPVRLASISDLNLRYFLERYLPAAFAPDVLESNDRTVEQRLLATKMATPVSVPVPTVVGLLTLGTNPRTFLPGSYIQFLRVQGTSLADPVVDEQVIDGTVEDMLRRMDEKLVAHNRVSVDFVSGTTEKRTPQYPLPALQQLVRNAVLHRSYQDTNAPVRVSWFDDRIDIHSPGGLYGSVTPENFGQPGVTDYRNPNLAEALRVLGLIQRFGAGIATARRTLAENGNPPAEFATTDQNYFSVTIRPRRVET